MIRSTTINDCGYYYRSDDSSDVEKEDPFFANPHRPLPPIEIPEVLFTKIQQAFKISQ